MPITPETDIRDRNWNVRGTGRRIRVRPGVLISSLVRAHGPLSTVPAAPPAVSGTTSSAGFRLEIEAVYSTALGHYTLRSCSLRAADEEEVTGAVLRTVTPLGLMRWMLPRTFEFDGSALSVPVADFVAPELKQYRSERSLGQSTSIELGDVGTVYCLATIVRYPPAKAVAETFGLQPRTATNWILRARAMGLT